MHESLVHHPLRHLIHTVKSLPEADRFQALASACLRHGGTLIPPGTASHMFEVSVLGAYARGPSRAELVRSWLGAASGQLPHAHESGNGVERPVPPGLITGGGIPVEVKVRLRCGTTTTLQTMISAETTAAQLHRVVVLSTWPSTVPAGARVLAVIFRRAS
ncbi:MAG: hypothetical protein Q8J98_03000 [Phaeovulum sp.]|uniref:hypothetical protein n=1 Tax=Phaeovulum sp. TaxID=2934796 RepID=UPI0027310E92|nr:hypothetical protein [Phaeovulum sp.]MDP2062056.1 hypothetical protein [Phaeovulum sp.]